MASKSEVMKKSKRIFINHVDSYQGKNISKFLSNCVVGASLEDAEEGGSEAGSIDSETPPKPKEGTYDIIGTLKDPNQPKPNWVQEIIDYSDKEQLAEYLVECDFVIYDINDEPDQVLEATWAISAMHAELEHFETQKIFILVSTVMTWAKSKPLDPDEPEIPFTEDDYRRRKPHPNFKSHISCEKQVIKLGKTNKQKMISYVISAGLTYGGGENIFHYLLKTAWHGQSDALQCYGNGQNVIPTIHINDLAAVLQNICDSKPKTRYLLAVDDSQTTLEEIVKSISQNLTTGKVKYINKEEALLSKDIEQADFDRLLVNLRMDAVFVKENMNINWMGETGLPDNVQNVIKEFREIRKLLPLRICILGPPAAGKSTLADKICKHYKLHHIRIKDVIDEALEKLEKSAARADEETEEDDDVKAQEDQELFDTIKDNMTQNNGRIDDQYIIKFFKEKLHSMPCQNQGFVLDGYPKTYEQAKELFAPDDEEEAEESSKSPAYDRQAMPEFLFSLDASDQYLKDRIMNLPERVVTRTHNTEEGLTKRLSEYRSVNVVDTTVLHYFDELEIHPEYIDVMKDESTMMEETVLSMKKTIGEPRNYGPTQEEIQEMEVMAAEEKIRKDASEKEELERRESEEAAERKHRQEEWTRRLDEVKREEQEVLEAQSVPLRNYLMKHVMPTLTQGLIDCCKVRPDDAIDYLAEYLFRNNPQID